MFRTTASVLSLAALFAVGCGQNSAALDPVLAAQRNRYLLAAEPSDAVGVLELREAVGEGQDVVVVGKIGGIADPWTKGRAAFVIADPALAAETGGHGHQCSEDCPFCNKKSKPTDALALIELVDDDGQVVPIDARELLGVAADQTVVVRGRARLDKLGYLVVAASGCYVRR